MRALLGAFGLGCLALIVQVVVWFAGIVAAVWAVKWAWHAI